MTANRNIKLSKFLSRILRHKPELVGLELDRQGWANVAELIELMQTAGKKITFESLKEMVETDPKNRYAFDDGFKRIRANQGHSIPIDLGYKPLEPPEVLYHGSAGRFKESILEKGLHKRKRHHVHLSPDVETALVVGRRHGEPVVFEVLAREMHAKGYEFYLSENQVWLTEHVPSEFLRVFDLP